MAITRRLLRYMDIQSGEEKNFSILFLQSLLVGFATSFFFVSATAHFIKNAGVQNLPLAYLISGVVGFVLVSAYKKVQSSAGIVFSYVAGLVLYAVLCLGLYFLYEKGEQSHAMSVYLAYTGLVLIMPFVAIFSIGFSVLSLQVFSFAQSKRLLAMVGTGETVAAIIAFISVPFLMKLVGDSVQLLPMSAVLVLLALLPIRRLVAVNQNKFAGIVKKANKQVKLNFAFFRKEKFYTAIMLFTFFSVLAIYLADYSYLIAVRYLSVQTEIETASIVAVIFSVIKTGELLISFLSRKLINKNGMRVSLLLLPFLLILFSALALASALLHTEPLFLLFFLVINKFNERVVRKGITTPSMKVIYQVTEPVERAQLQTSIEGIFSQLATIAAGGLLVLISLFYSGAPGNVLKLLNLVTVSCLVIYIGWLFSSFKVFSTYKQKINQFLFSKKTVVADHSVVQHLSFDQWLTSMRAQGELVDGEALGAVNPENRQQLLSVIMFYNPSLKEYTFESEPDFFFKSLEKAYFNNDNFFNRVSIIWFAAFLPEQQQLHLFKEAYWVSNQFQKLLLIRLLNKGSHKTAQTKDFYFINLAQECVKEAMQLESAINDLASLEDRVLPEQLQTLLKRQKNILLELLKVLYDPAAMSVIQSVINEEDSSEEHQQFAVELLSNILEPGMKEYVLPVFESIPFADKKTQVADLLFIYELSVAERLKDIVMMDVKLVNPFTKQLAMQAYYSMTGDRQLLSAFKDSNWTNLSQYALHTLENSERTAAEALYHDFEKKLSAILEPAYLSLYSRYGTGENRQQLSSIQFKGKILKVDLTGLAMMFTLPDAKQHPAVTS
jgi:MFS family permease